MEDSGIFGPNGQERRDLAILPVDVWTENIFTFLPSGDMKQLYDILSKENSGFDDTDKLRLAHKVIDVSAAPLANT